MPRLGRIVAVALAALALAAPAAASERHPTLSEMESEIMCPECKEPLDMSDSAVAKRIEVYIQHRIDAGATKSQIKHELVQQFGPQILADSPDPWPRRLPLIGGAIALLAVGFGAWRWSRARSPVPEVDTDPELDSRVDEALARFDE